MFYDSFMAMFRMGWDEWNICGDPIAENHEMWYTYAP